jgi:predicted HicB family RNase H-like nuclease
MDTCPVFRSERDAELTKKLFYAKDVDGLRREGEISLRVFLEACAEDGVDPHKHFSGKFSLRVDPRLHEAAVIAAAAQGQSLNQWAAEAIRQAARAT